MSCSLANSTVAQLLLGGKGRDGNCATNPYISNSSGLPGRYWVPCSTETPTGTPEQSVIQSVGTNSVPIRQKRKRDASESKTSDSLSETCDSCSSSEDEPGVEGPILEGVTTQTSSTKCPLCSFTAESEAALRSHHFYHKRVLSGIGKLKETKKAFHEYELIYN